MSRRRPASGFSFVELLVIIVIIGLIAVLIIPVFLSTLDTGKQKRTMSNMNIVGKAMMSWLGDQLSAAAAGQRTVEVTDYGAPWTRAELESRLVPDYAPTIPEFDAWGGAIEYRMNLVDLSGRELIVIRSPGRDRVFSGDSYVAEPFDHREFTEDLVWADGVFIRWPERQ